jgi:hypothetical protein
MRYILHQQSLGLHSTLVLHSFSRSLSIFAFSGLVDVWSHGVRIRKALIFERHGFWTPAERMPRGYQKLGVCSLETVHSQFSKIDVTKDNTGISSWGNSKTCRRQVNWSPFHFPWEMAHCPHFPLQLPCTLDWFPCIPLFFANYIGFRFLFSTSLF